MKNKMIRIGNKRYHDEEGRKWISIRTTEAMKRPEVKDKLIGRKLSAEHINKLRMVRTGTKETEEHKNKIRNTLKEGYASGKYISPWKGKPSWHSGKTKIDFPQLSNAGRKKGSVPWNFGLNKNNNEIIRKQSEKMMNHPVSVDARRKISNSNLIAFAEGRRISPMKNPKIVRKVVNTRKARNNYIPTEETKMKIKRTCLERGVTFKKRFVAYGDKHPMWNGGTGEEPYPFGWKHIKRKALERDKFTCCVCESKTKPSVHHIDYNKKNLDLMNLITLCNSCHGKTVNRRPYWTWQLGVYNKLFNGGQNENIVTIF